MSIYKSIGYESLVEILIKVYPDQRVVATVPDDATDSSIYDALLKRARWVSEKIKDFSTQKEYVMPRQYVSGESQFYLGRRYMLKVLASNTEIPGVKLLRGKLVVTLKRKILAFTYPSDTNWKEVKSKLDAMAELYLNV
jgi:predicted metal-dependent hydrolase